MSAQEHEIELRACRPGDIPAIAAIYREAVINGRASFEIEPPEPHEMEARRENLELGGYPYIVADLDGEIVGYAHAGRHRSRPAYALTIETSVYVKVGFQGRGIGRRLMERLIAEAEQRGFRQVVAVIGDSENKGSIELHRRVGFSVVGTLRSVGWKHNQWLDTVLMQRALGPGDGSPPG